MNFIQYYLNILVFVFTTFVSADIIKSQIIELNSKNLITLRGTINTELSSRLINKINKFSHNNVYLYITSPGGSVLSGLQIIDQLQTLAYRNITLSCIADYAASMAFVIFQSCPNRYVTLSSILMQHQMSLELKGNIENVNSKLAFIKNIDINLDKLQANKLNMSIKEFKEKTNNDWWLTQNTIIESNAADDFVVVFCNSELVDMTENIVQSNFFFDIIANFSLCPILNEPLEIKYSFNFNNNTIDKNSVDEILTQIIPSKFIKNIYSQIIL